jgi:hypothetical protein
MIVRVTIPMHMRRRAAINMNHAGHMTFASQARRDRVLPRQGEGDRRRQHAQQIDQGDKPPCSQPLHSSQTNQHLDAISSYQPVNMWIIDANPALANVELASRR